MAEKREGSGGLRTVLFEVADFSLCLRLYRRLQGNWRTWLVGRSEARFVAVEIDPEDVSMEMLTQTVSEWAGEVGLRFVNFHVGEQMFVLVATTPGPGSVPN
jgi:hypothetical protein